MNDAGILNADPAELLQRVSACNKNCIKLLNDGRQNEASIEAARLASVVDQISSQSRLTDRSQPMRGSIAEHYIIRGYVAESAAEALRWYRTAFAWDSEHMLASELLSDAEYAAVIEQLDLVVRLVDAGDQKSAARVLDSIPRNDRWNALLEEVQSRIAAGKQHSNAPSCGNGK